MAYVSATVAEGNAVLAQKLSDVTQALDDLRASVVALEGHTEALADRLDVIIAKFGAGLPSTLSSGKLKVTGLL